MIEERRQKLLELYGIGVMQLIYSKTDSGMWYGIFHIHGEDHETDNFPNRRQAEDQAIKEYESISETGTK